MIQLANSLLSQKNSFDLVKKSTRIGTLFHKFTNLKLETEQLNTIRNNNKAFDSDRDHKHKTKATLISEKFTERIGNISLQIRSEQNKLRVLRLNSSLVAELDMRTASFNDSTKDGLSRIEQERKSMLQESDW